jgi:hypothetical protein
MLICCFNQHSFLSLLFFSCCLSLLLSKSFSQDQDAEHILSATLSTSNSTIPSPLSYDAKIFPSDGIPYQRFGQVIASNSKFLFISNGATNIPKMSKVYVYRMKIMNVTQTVASATSGDSKFSNAKLARPFDESPENPVEGDPLPNDDELPIASISIGNSVSPVNSKESDPTVPSKVLNFEDYMTISTLTPGDHIDGFGWTMVANEEYLVIGAPLDDGKFFQSGRVYVYTMNSIEKPNSPKASSPSTALPPIKATHSIASPSTNPSGENFGTAVALFGNLLAVSSNGPYSGAVYFYLLSPT